jgi:hypothetical protein
MTTIDTAGITEQNGVLIGPYRAPRNLAANQRGSIHDDATAQNLGFRGGTVAGSIHMEQFPPILLRAFDQRWFERGTLSCYFRNATVDGERVRTLVQAPTTSSDAQVNIWMERDDGMRVLDGTASVGNSAEETAVQRAMRERPSGGDLRILSHLSVGQQFDPVPTRVTERESRPRLDAITERLPWYDGKSPWGGPILNPGLAVHAMVAVQQRFRLNVRAVGLYGAIEVRHINGPIFLERDYEAAGSVLGLGESPKSEYIWYESRLREPGSAKDVASMIMMLRFMKASSELWA